MKQRQWIQLWEVGRATGIGVFLLGNRALLGTGVAQAALHVLVELADSRIPALCEHLATWMAAYPASWSST